METLHPDVACALAPMTPLPAPAPTPLDFEPYSREEFDELGRKHDEFPSGGYNFRSDY